MKTYARISNGAVAELLATAGDISKLFNPALTWVDVTAQPPQVGWLQQPTGSFIAPPVAAPVTFVPTLASLQAQLASLAAEIAALAPKPPAASAASPAAPAVT